MNILVQLDKDGDPLTKKPGSLTGNYNKYPVEISSQNVDSILNEEIKQKASSI